MSLIARDPYYSLDVISCTKNPQQTIWYAMHQDYSANMATEDESPDEKEAGEAIVRCLLSNKRGHFGPFEHPQIVFNAGYMPHSVVVQARTHRVGCSFDVQSFRYTSDSIIRAAIDPLLVEEAVYFRPVGFYTDRQGKKYEYTKEMRYEDILAARIQCRKYYIKVVQNGMSEEHARGMLPTDLRQHFVVSMNMRSLMHFLDLRSKKDAQLEIQWFSDMLMDRFTQWAPQVAAWYLHDRLGKALLSP